MEDIWRFDINFIEILKVPVSTFIDAGLMEVPWRFHGGLILISWRF